MVLAAQICFSLLDFFFFGGGGDCFEPPPPLRSPRLALDCMAWEAVLLKMALPVKFVLL